MKSIETKMIPLAQIDVGSFQIRNEAGRAVELVGSLRSTGQLHPIIVRPKGNRYELIAGHIRQRAQVMSGSTTIEAKIVECDDQEAWVVAVTENMARTDMTPVEKEHAIALLEKLGMTQKEIARATGISQPYVSQLARANTFREKYKIGPEVHTRTITDTEPLHFPRLRILLFRMVSSAEIAPTRVRSISQAFAEKASILNKLDDFGVRNCFLNPRQDLAPDHEDVLPNQHIRQDLRRLLERLVAAVEAADEAERREIAELAVNFFRQYAETSPPNQGGPP